MPEAPVVPGPVRALAAQLAAPTPMRRGALSERHVKCSKPGCLCAERSDARPGPYYSLTRAVGGRTQSRFVRAEAVARVRHQIQAGRRFRQQVEASWEACEHWADAELEGPGTAAQEAAEKGGSRRPSRRRSPRRSRRA